MAGNFIQLRFAVEGDVMVSRVFDTMGQKITDISPALKEMADSFYRHMTDVFENEGAVDKRPIWHPLSPSYRRWKAKHYPGAKILHLTGALEDSLTKKGDSHAVMTITKTEMKVGTDLPYAMAHQKGVVRGNYILPERKIIELTDSVKKEWTSIMHRFLYRIMQESRGNLNPGPEKTL